MCVHHWICIWCFLFAAPPKIEHLPPRYTTGLKFCCHDTIRARIPFTGHPAPDVTWARDGEILIPSRRVDIEVNPRHSTLMIYDTEKANAGTYTITISNRLGSDSTKIPIGIIGEFRQVSKSGLKGRGSTIYYI